MLPVLFRKIGLIGTACLVVGCANESSAISGTLGLLLNRDSVDKITLNPNLRYLRATAQGNTALLVLGYVEPHTQGDIEVWYSAKGEVLRLQNGRIVGTSGLKLDWRSVRYPTLPPWSALTEEEISFMREHDETPGYRYGIRKEIHLRKTSAITGTNLVGIDPTKLQWFIEEVKPSTPTDNSPALPSTVYAVLAGRVVYGAQCLDRELCITWQRWPVTGP